MANNLFNTQNIICVMKFIIAKNGGKTMRKLSEGEVLSLGTMLKMENDGLAVAKTMQALITDDELKRQAEASVLAMEGRIKGIQQFINENGVSGEVH